MNKKIHPSYPSAILLLMVFILSTCGKKPDTLTHIRSTSTNSPISIPTIPANTSTLLPTGTATFTPMPRQSLQLTYTDHQNGIDKIYTLPIECPETTPPCISERKLLFEFDAPIYSLNWSPDGKQVVFEALGVGGKGDVFIADWNGEKLINLTHSPEDESSPVWSPDGKRIGYIGCISYIGCKFISSAPDGTNSIQLLSKLGDVANTAVWSPNGAQLLFSGSIHEPFNQLYLSNLDGSGLIKLTRDDTEHCCQVFSPDGNLIAFVRVHNPEEVDWSDIFLINPDGSGETNLTNGLTTFQGDIAWAPIGNWIAFSGEINDRYEIYMIHPNGKDVIKVANGEGIIGNPAWRLSYIP